MIIARTLVRCTFPFLILILFLYLSACGNQNEQQQRQQQQSNKKIKLSIGLIPEQNIFRQKEKYTPLAKYLEQKTGTEIELKMLSRYGNIVDNFIQEKLDGAFLGSFTFCLVHAKLDIEPIARPVKLDGTSTYYGMVFVRKDSGISSGLEMKGKRFAFVDKATTAGYLLPLHYFKKQGIQDYHAWLGETYFAGTHEDAINDVLNKKADIGAAKNSIFFQLAQKDKKILDELQILADSPPVPENGLAVRHDLDPLLKKKLRETLLKINTSPEGRLVLQQLGAIKFVETRDEDYSAVYQFTQNVGIDLGKYDYIND